MTREQAIYIMAAVNSALQDRELELRYGSYGIERMKEGIAAIAAEFKVANPTLRIIDRSST